MVGKTVEQLKIGDSATASRTVSEADVYGFGGIIGDLNPLHTDKVAAGESVFGKRVAHGMLTASLLSGVLAHQLPGNGTIFLGLNVNFKAPVYFGDTVTAEVEVSKMRPEKRIVTLECRCSNQDGDLLLEGEATVLAPKEPS